MGFSKHKEFPWEIEQLFLCSTGSPFLSCNSEMIKIKFWLHFYRLPFSFSQSLIMQKLKGTAFLVYGITFCNDVIYACILVKILNMVTDFCLTYSHAGEVCLHFWEWFWFFFLGELICLTNSHLSFSPFLSQRRERARSITNQREKKCCGSFFTVFPVAGLLHERNSPAQCSVCMFSADSKPDLAHCHPTT